MGCNVTAAWRAHRRGAALANPCFTQIHPTSIPATGALPVEAHADERVASERRAGVGPARRRRRSREPGRDPRGRALLLPRGALPALREPRAPRRRLARGQDRLRRRPRRRRHRPRRLPRLPRRDLATAARTTIEDRYGNLFEMYERITGDSPWKTPMMIYPAPHYSMGGLWVDYELQTTIPGLFAIGEANFSDHGANRLGASAMMQCLADGYFIVPHTVTNFVSGVDEHVATDHPAFEAAERDVRERIDRLLGVGGTTPQTVFHRELGHVMLDHCGITRDADGLREAMGRIAEHHATAFWSDLRIEPGEHGHQPERSSTPGGSPTSSSWRADVPRRARARGVVRLPPARGAPDRGRARPCATTSASPTSRSGSGRARAPSHKVHREQLEFESVTPRDEELQVRFTLRIWRQADAESEGAFERYEIAGDRPRRLVPGDARRPQRPPRRRAGERPVAFDSRLPRGHLRRLLAGDRRHPPRARARRRAARSSCATSTTAPRSPSSRSAAPPSRSCAT